MKIVDHFDEVWCADTEFECPPGHIQNVRCLCAYEVKSGRRLMLWADELARMDRPPFRTDDRALFVAYNSPAEFGSFLSLGWHQHRPANVLDLFVEFRWHTNGLQLPSGRGLVGALAYFGLDSIDAAEKDAMRDLAMRPGPSDAYTPNERTALLEYCMGDVVGCVRLLGPLGDKIDLPRALIRGRFGWSVAVMEANGVPVDVGMLNHLRDRWDSIKGQIAGRVNAHCGMPIYDEASFREEVFRAWLSKEGIPWPHLPTGHLDLEEATFRGAAKSHPRVAKIHEGRYAMGKTRLFQDIAVGPDGRNRTPLWQFNTTTARCSPSPAKFLFGASRALRCLVRPQPARALIAKDWSQQEFAIAAHMSGDEAMQHAYTSGDPYLYLAKASGAVPQDATKQSHPVQREQFKVATLGIQFGMSAFGLALKLGRPLPYAEEILRSHKRVFSRYWEWADAAVTHAFMYQRLHTAFGWQVRVGHAIDPFKPAANPRSLANFPCQAHGSEMLRLACNLMVDRGVTVVAPVHDAIVVECAADAVEETDAAMDAAMTEASAAILLTGTCGTDTQIVHHPHVYVDKAGVEFWNELVDMAGPLPQQQPSNP